MWCSISQICTPQPPVSPTCVDLLCLCCCSFSWLQRYNQVSDNFIKSDHPAVARTKPQLSSPFPIANPSFGSPSSGTFSFHPEVTNQSPNRGDFRQEADTQEVITSYNEYIIPIPDPKPEEVFTDVPSESPVRYGKDAADAEVAWKMRMYLLKKSSLFPSHTHSSRCWAGTIAVLWKKTWRCFYSKYIHTQPSWL